MNFFEARKKRKLLADMKNRRHAEDDLLSPALRRDLDILITELQTALGICDLMWFLSPEVNGIRSSDRSPEEAALCIWEVMPVWECLQGSCP